jgi:hypothetical protein
LLPKTIALRYPERLSMATLAPMRLSLMIFKPLIFIFNGPAFAIMRLLKLTVDQSHTHVHSPEELEGLFKASVPDYQKLPGLVRKYFTIGDDGRAGGIYLWSSRAAAEAWFTDAWKAGVQKRWGAPVSVSYFDVPVVVDGANPAGFGTK